MNYNINKDITGRIIDDEVILLNIENGCYYSLNPIGTEIWNIIKDKPGFSDTDINNFISENYEVDSKTVKKDIKNLIKDLIKENIINEIKPHNDGSNILTDV